MRLASSGYHTYTKSAASHVFIGKAAGRDTRIEGGFYVITLRQGSALAVGEIDGLPLVYALRQNYPNPFNPSTTIKFDLPVATEVSLVIYDLLGQEVVWLASEQMEPGYHQIVWKGETADGRSVPSGIYIARLLTPEYRKSIKMVLLK